MLKIRKYTCFQDERGKALIVNFQYKDTQEKDESFAYLTLIKKKGNEWEKPSSGQGLTAKLSMKEVVGIRNVLKNKVKEWKCNHIYKESRLDIIVKWEKDEKPIKSPVGIDLTNVGISLVKGNDNREIQIEQDEIELLKTYLLVIIQESYH